MKITAVESILLVVPYRTSGGLQHIAGRPSAGLNMLLVRIETDQGIIGWGEGFGHAVSPATKTVLDTLVGPMLIGRDARDIEAVMGDLQRTLHLFGRNGPVMYALSGVDIALWDIAGKAAGTPLYRLLGGAERTSLAAYSSLLRCTGPQAVAESCGEAVANGFRHIKLHEITVPAVQAARAAVGPDVALMLDTNCPWSRDEARAMVEALRPCDLYWLEEPLWPPEDYAGLARLRAMGAKIAAGENANLTDFRPMFELGALDFAQPSVAKIGGVSEMRRIIALAHDFGIEVVPHCGYLGAGLLATIHIAASMGDVLVERLGIDLAASPFGPFAEIENGRARVPQGPGVGHDPDPALIARYRTHEPNIIR
jgi:L-alanine-DL-glutamate epimerase-like enolase superfamily enzyme